MLSSKERNAGQVRCPLCSLSPTADDETGAAHFSVHAAAGEVAVIEGNGVDWYLDDRTGLVVWRVEVDRQIQEPEPFAIAVERIPTRMVAAKSILIALLPSLLAAVVFWRMTSSQPFLEWAAGPSAFIIVMRGVRRMAARVMLARRRRRAVLPLYADQKRSAQTVRAGEWIGVAPGRAARVVAVEELDSGLKSFVFANGATVAYEPGAHVSVGAVMSEYRPGSPPPEVDP